MILKRMTINDPMGGKNVETRVHCLDVGNFLGDRAVVIAVGLMALVFGKPHQKFLDHEIRKADDCGKAKRYKLISK
jgi:hypothetical protein